MISAVVTGRQGDTITDGEVKLTCLNPAPDYVYPSQNASSIVLSVSYEKFDMLLTGDLEDAGEDMVQMILKEYSEYSADSNITSDNYMYQGIPAGSDYDVLKVAHHGSKYSTSDEFLTIIKPDFSLISCGKYNPYGHPHKEVIKRLKECKSNIMITSKHGAIMLKTDGNKLLVDYYLKERVDF